MKGARLEVSDPLGRTHILPFEDDRFTIGCRHGNTLSLGSPEFSRLHSEIIKEGETATSCAISVRASNCASRRPARSGPGYGQVSPKPW